MKQPQINPVSSPQAYPAPGQNAAGQMPAQVPIQPGQMPVHGQAPGQVPIPGQAPMAHPVMQPAMAPQGQEGLPPMPIQGQPQYQQPQPGMPNSNAVNPSGSTVVVPMVDQNREGGEKALPRIAIHAFCDRSETAATIQATTQDWRMARTNIKIYMGGLPAAIEYYRNEATPSLIIVESGMRGQELFTQLEQLASVCDADTKVVMIGAVNDIKLYRDLMEQGLSEYLVPPFHPLTLIRSISDMYADPEKPFVGKVVAFYGAKGGSGSSTIAHNVAWGLATKMLQETALVDLDSSWGTTGLDFNYDSSQGLEEALADYERLDDTLLDRIMIRHTEKLSILPAAASLGSTAPTSPEAYEALVNGMRALSPMTLLDMPHVWSAWSKEILKSADEVVITATPDLANLRNAKNLIEFLKQARPNDPDPLLVLNKTGVPKTAEIPVKDFAAAVGINPSLVLAYEPIIYTEASNDGKMLSELTSAKAASDGIMYLTERLKTGVFPLQMEGKSKGKLRKSKASKKGKKSGGLLSSLRKKK